MEHAKDRVQSGFVAASDTSLRFCQTALTPPATSTPNETWRYSWTAIQGGCKNKLTAALKIQRQQSAATYNDHSRMDARYTPAYISQPDYLGKISQAHTEFFFGWEGWPWRYT